MKVTVELSTESLAALADALVVRLKDACKPPERFAPKCFVTRAEAVRMGVERRVLQRAERSGQLEAFKPGRVVMYRRRDIEAFVEAHKVLPGPEPAGSATAELTSADSFERALRHADGRRRG